MRWVLLSRFRRLIFAVFALFVGSWVSLRAWEENKPERLIKAVFTDLSKKWLALASLADKRLGLAFPFASRSVSDDEGEKVITFNHTAVSIKPRPRFNR